MQPNPAGPAQSPRQSSLPASSGCSCQPAAGQLLSATLGASQLSQAMVRKPSQGHGITCRDSKMDAALRSPPTYSQTGLPGCSLWRASGANGGIPKPTGRWPALTKNAVETNSSPSVSLSVQEPVTGRFALLGWLALGCFFFIFLCRNPHCCPHKLHSCFDIVNLK